MKAIFCRIDKASVPKFYYLHTSLYFFHFLRLPGTTVCPLYILCNYLCTVINWKTSVQFQKETYWIPLTLKWILCHTTVVELLSHVWLFVTSWTITIRLLCPSYFPSKNTGVDCHFLHQGIFQTVRFNLHILPCRWIIYHWSTRQDRQMDRLVPEDRYRHQTDRQNPWRTIDRSLWYSTGGSDQYHPQEKEMQKGKMIV